MRRLHGVNLAAEQHLVQRAVGITHNGDPVRRADGHLLLTARLMDAGLDPFHVAQTDAELLTKEAPRIDAGGLRPFRNTYPLALEITRPANTTIHIHVDRGVPEHPRRKHRKGDEGAVVLGQDRDVAPHRHLGDVEFTMPQHAEEDFLHRHTETRQRDTVRADTT